MRRRRRLAPGGSARARAGSPRACRARARRPSADRSASRSSLSHWITVRSGIAAFSIGTSSCERPARDHEAADVLREMARKADERRRRARPAARITGLSRIEAGFAQPLGHRVPAVPPGERLREPVDLRELEAERLADVAHRAARAVADDGGGDARRGRGRTLRRRTGSLPRAARARNRRRCRAARCARAK